jgi:voltage-gated potassium channel
MTAEHQPKRIKQRTYEILEADRDGDRTSRVVDILLLVLIVLNVLALVVETVDQIGTKHQQFFHLF